MSIDTKIQIDQDLLMATLEGVENSISEAIDYIETIKNVAKETLCIKILFDHRKLEYNLSEEESIKLSEYINQTFPSIGRAAVVYNTKYKGYIDEWGKSVQKVHNLKFSTDFDAAREWVEQ